MRFHRDERGIIISWFVKVGLFLAVLGVVLFDVGSVVVNAFTLDSAARDVAISVSLTVDTGAPPASWTDDEIRELARAELIASDIEKTRVLRKGTTLDDATGIVYVVLRRRANTFVAKYISALDRFIVATGTGQAGTK